jgi:poly-gamma-glutamate capsule biosynthesis protein CapA/YwtB (metallophosphatase superfamily)
MREFNDYTHPFHRVAAILKSYDLTIANLEGNLSDNLEVPTEGATFDFLASAQMIDGFDMAGIDAVSQANNHSTWNNAGWGTQGLTDTIDALDARSFGHFGGGRTLDEARAAYTTEVAGKSIAIIGIDGVTANVEAREPNATVNESWLGGARYAGATSDSPGTYPYDPDIFLAHIEALVGQYDIVIPYFHFGIEYVEAPPQWAVDGARAAIDAGATLVVTNHPHVIQGQEFYGGKPIVYSVGNFIFDQMFSVQTRQGLILELVLRGGKCVGLRTRGVEIEDFNQPRLMNAGEQAAIMDRYWTSTDRLANR